MSYTFNNLDVYSSGQQNMIQGNSMAYNFDAPNAQSHDAISFANLHIIRHASKAALLASQNVLFSQLYEENIRLKAQLDEKECNTIRQLSQMAVNTAPTERLTNPQPPASRTTDPIRPSGSIQIPPSPPLCMSDDYPFAAFWTREEWTAHTQTLSANGTPFKKLDFLTDEEGRLIDKERLAVISKEAKMAWAELHYHRLDPRSWGLKTTTAAEYFSNYMRTKFVEFQLCESDWKIELYGTVKYSEWTPTRNSGTLLRQTPSNRVTTKVEGSTTIRKPQTQKRLRIPPGEIIELDSDDDKKAPATKKQRIAAPNPTIVPTTPATVITTITTANPPPIPTSAASTTIATAPAPTTMTTTSTPPPAPSLPTTTSTAPVAAAAATPIAPSVACKSNIGQPPLSAAPSTAAPAVELIRPQSPPHSPLPQSPSLTSSDEASNKPDSAGQAGSEFANNDKIPTTATPGPTASVGSRTRGNRQNGTGILSNMTIPKPSSDLLAPVGDTRPSNAASTSETAKARGGKGDKFAKDNGTTSARNLYLIDYIKEHGPTGAAAFKEIWDHIDAETAKKYKSLSAAAKKTT